MTTISESLGNNAIHKMYSIRGLCRKPHNFKDARVSITFEKEVDDNPYFPFPMFVRACTRCGEIDR